MPNVHIKLSLHGHQKEKVDAFASAFDRHGIEYDFKNPRGGDWVLVWGWRAGADYRRAGCNVIVAERGYIGDRFKYTSIGLNGLNGRATFVETPDPDRRFEPHKHLLKQWDPHGYYVLICGQVPGDAALGGVDLNPWYRRKADEYLSKGYRVKFRPHPLGAARGAIQHLGGCETDSSPLHESLSGAGLVITYNSNTGVDALLAGKSATCENEGALIHRWDGSESDRIRFLKEVCCYQWLDEEIASGQAIENLAEIIKNG